MTYIVTWLLVAIAAVFALSLVGVCVLAHQARRGNPRVVAADPWDETVLADYDEFNIVSDVVAEAEAYVKRAAL